MQLFSFLRRFFGTERLLNNRGRLRQLRQRYLEDLRQLPAWLRGWYQRCLLSVGVRVRKVQQSKSYRSFFQKVLAIPCSRLHCQAA
jgi:hypothetical protein